MSLCALVFAWCMIEDTQTHSDSLYYAALNEMHALMIGVLVVEEMHEYLVLTTSDLL